MQEILVFSTGLFTGRSVFSIERFHENASNVENRNQAAGGAQFGATRRVPDESQLTSTWAAATFGRGCTLAGPVACLCSVRAEDAASIMRLAE